MTIVNTRLQPHGQTRFIRALATAGIPDAWAQHLPSLHLALFDPTTPSRERVWFACHEFAAFLVALPELLGSDTMRFLIGIPPVDAALLPTEALDVLTDWYGIQNNLYRWQLELVTETADDATRDRVLAHLADLVLVRLDALLIPRLRQARFAANKS